MSGSERPPEAEFREYARGKLPKQAHRDVYEWAGLVRDPVIASHLAFCEANYKPTGDMPKEFKDTEYCQEFLRKYGSETAAWALEFSKQGYLNFFSGLVGYEKDVSGLGVLMSLQDMMRNVPVFIGYIYGIMGAGKTDFALLIIEVMKSVWGAENVDTVANISSEDINEETKRYSRIVELLEERRERIQAGEDLDPLVILIDEAAQIFTGSGADQHRAKQLAKLLKLARKSNAHMLLIGQDGKDIDASLRALCTVFIHKKSKKQATFYRDVKDRKGIGEMMNLSGIPPTSIDYSTWDEGDFIFDDEGDEDDLLTQEDLDELKTQHEREMMAILDATTDMTQAEIGDVYGVSDKTVRRAKQKYEGELRDLGLID
ncbi:AAA family ATPase [Natronobeatus ordinarius]|uniref:AAA family ATPase n=1 Tax=Natronobeatus ordinarius TaxID=2963433 RepID=UPI0020CC66DB|nr:AAA family ATPase [Natronobeatus ordinarius]